MKNSHEALFFKSIIKNMPFNNVNITSRNYAELNKLLEKYEIDYKTFGGHGGTNFLKKVYERVIKRNYFLLRKIEDFDIALSFMSFESALVGKIKGKKVISFTDNEIPQLYTRASVKLINHLILPSAITNYHIRKMGASNCNCYFYDGFKEDIYIADYVTNANFMESLPFESFVVVRPEAYKAAYLKKRVKTVVPELVKLLIRNGEKVLYLPRYPEDRFLIKDFEDNVFIPSEPLNGLDVCYYSKCVLTGSGTFAREAACLGVPAVSFFSEKLLAVDQKMVDDGWIFHSRKPKEIMEYVLNSNKKIVDFSRSKKVQKEVFGILESIFEEHNFKQ